MVPGHPWPRMIVVMMLSYLMVFTGTVSGAENRFSLIPYVMITTGDGEPAHDIPRVGLQGRYLLNRDLYLTMNLEYTEYDFEKPYKLFGSVA